MRMYRYVGPPDLALQVRRDRAGWPVRSTADLVSWLERHSPEEPFTFVIDSDSVLRLAPRRSEHVACAAGRQVLSAGEMTFSHNAGHWVVSEISNQSTGYCPDVSSWPAVAGPLDRAGLEHPAGFTHELIFRRCLHCDEVNVVREDDYVCVFCEAGLPKAWNVTD